MGEQKAKDDVAAAKEATATPVDRSGLKEENKDEQDQMVFEQDEQKAIERRQEARKLPKKKKKAERKCVNALTGKPTFCSMEGAVPSHGAAFDDGQQKYAAAALPDGDEVAAANDAAAKELADATAAAAKEALENVKAQNDEIAAANDATTKELFEETAAASGQQADQQVFEQDQKTAQQQQQQLAVAEELDLQPLDEHMKVFRQEPVQPWLQFTEALQSMQPRNEIAEIQELSAEDAAVVRKMLQPTSRLERRMKRQQRKKSKMTGKERRV